MIHSGCNNYVDFAYAMCCTYYETARCLFSVLVLLDDISVFYAMC
jgi:hypothetical protein